MNRLPYRKGGEMALLYCGVAYAIPPSALLGRYTKAEAKRIVEEKAERALSRKLVGCRIIERQETVTREGHLTVYRIVVTYRPLRGGE